MFLFSPPFDERTKLATVNYSRENFNVINITISFDNLTKSQCFPEKTPLTPLQRLYGNLFKLHKILNNPYLNIQIKENVQYEPLI